MISKKENTEVGLNLEKLGWRQGTIIAGEELAKLIEDCNIEIDEATIAIITTHSCDIANNNLAQLPVVEIIFARVIESLNGNFSHSKNPRKLHLKLQKQTEDLNVVEDVYFEIKCFETIQIKKDRLLDIKISSNLSFDNNEFKSFIHWLAARFQRPALPSSFNDRINLNNGDKRRRKLASKLNENLIGLYIQIFPKKEIEESEVYSVNLLGLVSADFDGNIEKLKTSVGDYADIMKTAGIDVQYKVARKDEVSLAFIEEFDRFYYDDLSLRDNTETPADIQ